MLKCWVQTLLHLDNWEGQHTYNCHHHVTSCRVPFDLCFTEQQVNTDVKLAVPEGGSSLSSTRQYSCVILHLGRGQWTSGHMWLGKGRPSHSCCHLVTLYCVTRWSCGEMTLWQDDYITIWLSLWQYDMKTLMTVWQHNWVTRRSVSEELDTGHVVPVAAYDWVAAWGHFQWWRRPQTCHLWKLALGLYDVQMCSDFDRWETLAHRVGNWPFMLLRRIYGRSDLGHKFGHKFSISSHDTASRRHDLGSL